MREIELCGRTYVFDDDVAQNLSTLSERGWRKQGKGVAFEPRKVDTQAYGELKRGEAYTVAKMVYLIKKRKLPPEGLRGVVVGEDPYDFRWENIEWRTRQEDAVRKFNPERTPEGGITRMENGKYRARAFYEGKLHHVGVFDSEADAREARDRAVEENTYAF